MNTVNLSFVSSSPITTSSFQRRTCTCPSQCSKNTLNVVAKRQVTNNVRACVEQVPSNTSFNETGEQLVEAAMVGDTDFVKHILSLQPKVDPDYPSLKSPNRLNALMWACIEGHLQIFQLLIDAGVNIEAKDLDGSTPLLLALIHIASANPRPAPPPGFPSMKQRKDIPKQIPMVPKDATDHINIILQLIQLGADWRNIKSDIGERPLHIAVRRCQLPLIREFIGKGAIIDDTSNYSKESPLYIACKENHPSVVKLLCALGANVNLPNVFGWTPIIIASACGATEIVQILIDNGADVNIKASNAQPNGGITTALQEARKSSNPIDISKLLIRAGAL